MFLKCKGFAHSVNEMHVTFKLSFDGDVSGVPCMMEMRIFDVEYVFDEWDYLGVSGV